MNRCSVLTMIFSIAIFGVCGSQALLSTSLTGVFKNCDMEDECIFKNNNTFVQWGTPTIGNNRSGLEFVSLGIIAINIDQRVQIGSLFHHNWPITGNIPKTVDLVIDIDISSISSNITSQSFSFTLNIDETPNIPSNHEGEECVFINNTGWFGLYNKSMPCCPYYTPSRPCSDRIAFSDEIDVNKTFTINETKYTLRIEGFINYPTYELINNFITQEEEITEGIVYASLVAICANNATCDDGNECTFDECQDGFCAHNTSVYNGNTCELSPSKTISPGISYKSNTIQDDCYEYICMDGKCVKIEVNCSESSSSNNDDNNGDDDDDVDLLAPILSSLAALCLCLYLLPILCLPLLLCPLSLLLLKGVNIPSSIATRAPSPTELGSIADNPTYTPLGDAGDNPLYE